MSALQLRLRTPGGLLVDTPVQRVVAEDLDGWFGLRPGRSDLVAALPAGLLTYEDDKGEVFVAHAGGLLDLEGGECRVMCREAVYARELADISERLAAVTASRRARREGQEDVLQELVREALRRMSRGGGQ